MAMARLIEHGVVWPPTVHGDIPMLELLRGGSLLDGEGGDEVLGCAPYLIADALRSARPDRARALARRLPGMGPAPRRAWVARALRRYGARGAMPYGVHERLRARRDRPPPVAWLKPEVAATQRVTDDPWGWKRAPGPRWRAQLVDVVTRGGEALGAHDHFRREAALAGVTFRHPLRDPDLFETVLGLDPELMFDARLDRPLAREALAGLLPDEVRLGERKPYFNAVLEDALAGPDAAAAAALLANGAHVAAYVDLDLARAALARVRARESRLRDAPDLWRVLTLEHWLRAQ
jgi:Asparagine synthase